MSKRIRTTCFLICLVCCAGLTAVQIPKHPASGEPTFFAPDYGENNAFRHGHRPTDEVLDALLKSHEAREGAGALAKLNREDKRRLFSVVKVHLAGPIETDEVVLGSDPLSGADNYWFWIVRCEKGHAEVILFANGNTLELLPKSTGGYSDVRAVWWSAAGYHLTNIYRFNGKRYVLARAYSKTDRPTQ